MNRKLFASTAAGAALVAALGAGSYSWAHAGTTAATTTNPQVVATQVADSATTAPVKQGKLHAQAVKANAKRTKAQAKQAQQVSPQVSAGHALQHAYNRIAVYQTLPTTNAPAEAGQLVDKAKALYSTALSDYQAARYHEAAATANASDHATAAAIALVRIQLAPVTVPGLTPPPTLANEAANAPARLTKELTLLQKHIAAAQKVSSKAGSDAAFYLNIANTALTQTQQYVSSKAYGKARIEAHIANAAADVVLNLAHATAPSPLATATAVAQ